MSLDKKARSEALRVASLKQKKEEEKRRRNLISDGLNNVDKPNKNKIVFKDSDSEEEVLPQTSSTTSQVFSKRLKLFDDEEDQDDEQIVLPQRLAGKKGLKLLKMEAKFADSRFRMDNKFASSESEEDEEDELSKEKTKNRELLAKVLGKTVKPVVMGKSNNAPTRPFTRYDPENEEHVEWMRLYGETDKPKNKDNSSESENDDHKDSKGDDSKQVVEGTFFEMDSNFAEELRAKVVSESTESDGFSFLAMIGRKVTPVEKDKPLDTEQHMTQSNTRVLRILENGEDECSISEYEPGKTKKLLTSTPASFFLTGKELHVKSIVVNFRQTQSIEKTVGLWYNYRNSIMKIYRHKRKVARKQQREKNGKIGHFRSNGSKTQ